MHDSLVMSSADTFNDDHDFLIGFDAELATERLLNNNSFIRKMAEATKRTKTFDERYAFLKSGKGKHIVTAFFSIQQNGKSLMIMGFPALNLDSCFDRK